MYCSLQLLLVYYMTRWSVYKNIIVILKTHESLMTVFEIKCIALIVKL